MITAQEALARLKEGNQRFVEKLTTKEAPIVAKPELVEIQSPMAIVLGCSDARVPAEIVFDQTLGDLFVIRVAGNVVAPSGIGSVEFTVANFGTRACGGGNINLDERYIINFYLVGDTNARF